MREKRCSPVTLLELADSLVEDFDVVDLRTLLAVRCVEVVDVAAAGLILASADGELRVLASSSEAMRVLEVFEGQAEGDQGTSGDGARPPMTASLERMPPDPAGERGTPVQW